MADDSVLLGSTRFATDSDTTTVGSTVHTLKVTGISGGGGAGDASAANQDEQTALLTTIDADTGAMVTALQILDNIVSGSEAQVDIVAALPAGANTIGAVNIAAAQTLATVTTVGTVTTVSTVTALTGGGVASGATDSGNPHKVGGRYNSSPITLTNGQRGDLQMDAAGNTKVNIAAGNANLAAAATGGYTPGKLVSAASTNATVIKASAGTLGMLVVGNVNAAARYLKFYNKATAPTVGTDTPVQTYIIPGNTAGAGNNVPIPAQGLNFSTGIAFALTTEATDAGTTGVAANEIVVSYGYN